VSFNIVRFKIYRAVHAELLDDTEIHYVMAMRLHLTEDEAQTMADRLNETYLPAGGPWFVEPIVIQMTDNEHDEYAAWLRWSE